jgi:hypothetical protein
MTAAPQNAYTKNRGKQHRLEAPAQGWAILALANASAESSLTLV